MAGRELPNFQNDDRDFQLLQSSWIGILNPVITNVINNASLLTNVNLSIGVNSINHKLGRKLTGWYIVRMRNIHANVFDQQDSNALSDKTLILNSDAAVSVDLVVF